MTNVTHLSHVCDGGLGPPSHMHEPAVTNVTHSSWVRDRGPSLPSITQVLNTTFIINVILLFIALMLGQGTSIYISFSPFSVRGAGGSGQNLNPDFKKAILTRTCYISIVLTTDLHPTSPHSSYLLLCRKSCYYYFLSPKIYNDVTAFCNSKSQPFES